MILFILYMLILNEIEKKRKTKECLRHIWNKPLIHNINTINYENARLKAYNNIIKQK